MDIDAWHRRVLSHRGDVEFASGGRRYVVRDAVVTKYVVARLIIESPNVVEELR